MLRFLQGPVTAIIAVLIYIINIPIWGAMVFVGGVLKYVVPMKSWQAFWTRFLYHIPRYWADGNALAMAFSMSTKWDVRGLENLCKEEWYLLIANHQSWADIIALYHVSRRTIPPLKFFIKKELLYLPIIGQACWLIDFPFMERHSKEALKKNPKLRGKDTETTRKACQKFKKIPITLVSFLEGTRYRPEKSAAQGSPYQHLLRPKAGGVAFALETMGDILHKIIDVTIVYHGAEPTAWNFLCGRITKITMEMKLMPITPDLIGDYQSDHEFRKHFQAWLNARWLEKDKLINEIKENENATHRHA